MKRTLLAPAVLALFCASEALPQGRPVDWPAYGGDARRSGWERSDLRITKENAGKIELLFKRKLDGATGAKGSTPPSVIGLLISHKGFNELGFVQSANGTLLSLDVDLNKPFWQKKFDAPGGGCAGTPNATPALTPPAVFGRRPGGPAAVAPGPLPARLGGGGFGGSRPIWMLAADGQLRQINSADGSDQYPGLKFVPANSRATVLTMNDNVMYTATISGCGSSQDAIHAMDLRVESPVPVSFALNGAKPAGIAGFAVGNDGTVYVQTQPGESDPDAKKFGGTLLALSGKDLKLAGHFATGAGKAGSDLNAVTPVVFDYKGRDLVVTAGADGRLHLLDPKKLGEDHKTPLSKTAPVTVPGGGVWGGLSTWEDADGGRYVAAPVWGALSSDIKPSMMNGASATGSVVAFRVEEQGGVPVLTPAWVSRDLNSPVPVVVTQGVVFALSTGSKGNGRATLYALDAATGKELYSTGTQVTGSATLTGMSLANGRVFFTTADGTLWAFGIGFEI